MPNSGPRRFPRDKGWASQAELVVVEADHLVHRPAHVSWEQAGALFVAGTTAYAAVRAISLRAADTVVVSGAAGGVGSIAVQLARNVGAKVIGLASATNHAWLDDHGVIPVAYGEGVAERIRAASGSKIDAFIDTFGGGYVELALELGVAPDRIDTIIDFAAAAKHGVKTEGNSAAANAEVPPRSLPTAFSPHSRRRWPSCAGCGFSAHTPSLRSRLPPCGF